MKHKPLILLFLLSLPAILLFAQPDNRILVFVKTEGYHHQSIEAGKLALLKLGASHNVAVDTTADATFFNNDNLELYNAIVFLNTSGDVFNEDQQEAFKKYIQSGGGFVGIHSATDTEYEWPWYNKLVGAYFDSHPKQQEAIIEITNQIHPSTAMLPAKWKKLDEWYNFKSFNEKVNVLAHLDESSYEGGKMGGKHPFIWYHEYDGGRAFYTGIGHREDNYENELFLNHIWAAINWAMDKPALD